MTPFRRLLAAILLAGLALAAPLRAEAQITIAAAADLKFAMDDIVAQFKKAHPRDGVTVIYGSSGKFHAQIQQGAPFDVYFSADIALPRSLAAAGFAASSVKPYAVGRLVLWSASRDARQMTLADLADPSVRSIAIANPQHAPYGQRAEEALRAAGLWEKIQPKLVYGENIAQAALYAQTGNADIGIIALSLALNQTLAAKGAYRLIDDRLHQPLAQGYLITRRAAGNPLARQFADFVDGQDARAILARHGFALPGDAAAP